LVLSAVVLVVSTFISHTIASVLLVPIAAEVGKNLPQPHDRLLIFLTALICSAGMGMPVSGFPNQTAYVLALRNHQYVDHHTGQPKKMKWASYI
jgi:phosphate transporter